MDKKRDVVIDIARGLAIVLMVAANMAVLSHDKPSMFLRFTSSLAAPFFVTLAGTMAALGAIRGSSIGHFVKMGLFLLVVASLLDLGNDLSAPLINFDVLYLIGVSLPIAALAVRLPNILLLVLILIIIFVTPVLHSVFGYTIPVKQELVKHAFDLRTLIEAVHRMFIDGWFPIFPWLSFALIGVLIGKMRYGAFPKVNYFQQKKYVLTTVVLMIIGGIVWYIEPGLQVIREGYIELFYPTIPGFVIFTSSFLMGVLILLPSISQVAIWKYIQVLGEASLFMYIFHLVIIDRGLMFFSPMSYGWLYLSIYLALMAIMIMIGLLLHHLKSKPSYKSMPYIVKRLFGG